MPSGDALSTVESDAAVLNRMLRDADRLCATADPLLFGQFVHLRGRIAALVAIVADSGEDAGT